MSHDTPPDRPAGVDPERLLADLARAHAAASEYAGAEPLGVRAVELAPGDRGYLCAFDGPTFLCLAGDLRPARGADAVRDVAGAGLLWEHLEALVDPDALEELGRAIAICLARPDLPADAGDALQSVARHARDLAGWRARPERALASLVAVDEAVALQERVHGAWSLFVRASDPLVAVQDTLHADLVAALRAVEQAGAEARAPERLADLLGRALTDAAGDADQVVEHHLVELGR